MASLKDIQRKINSVSNTQKTTRAMKLVSTAKLRRTEELAKRSKFYAAKLNEVLSELTEKIQKYKVGGLESRCFAENIETKVVDIVFVTADKGLCGGFNAQTIKAVKNLITDYKKKNVKIRLRGVGKKGIDFFNFIGVEMLDQVRDLSASPSYERAAEFIQTSIQDYLEERTDKVVIIHNGYVNMITQELKVTNLLPISVEAVEGAENASSMLELEAENDEKMLNELVNKYVEFNMYYGLIDSLAAEHSARMQAMDTATNNASDMINTLTIQYNKARQEAITTELIEIISGVESLK